MDINFLQIEVTEIDKLVPHFSKESKEIIILLLTYDPIQHISVS